MRPLRGPAVRAKNDSPRGSVRALRIGGAKPKKCGVNYLFAGSCIIPAFAKDVKSLQNNFPLSAPPHDRFSGHTVWATRCGETRRQGPLDCGEGSPRPNCFPTPVGPHRTTPAWKSSAPGFFAGAEEHAGKTETADPRDGGLLKRGGHWPDDFGAALRQAAPAEEAGGFSAPPLPPGAALPSVALLAAF